MALRPRPEWERPTLIIATVARLTVAFTTFVSAAIATFVNVNPKSFVTVVRPSFVTVSLITLISVILPTFVNVVNGGWRSHGGALAAVASDLRCEQNVILRGWRSHGGALAAWLTAVLVITGACTSQTLSNSHTNAVIISPDGLTSNAIVERVIDGDTILASISGRSESVRLLGIDAPESVARTRPVQCYGKEASLYLAHLLPIGTRITLVLDTQARDAYDRLLAYVVRTKDSLFVNLDLINHGYAAVLNIEPNNHYAYQFARAESAAVTSNKGLWAACGGPDVPIS